MRNFSNKNITKYRNFSNKNITKRYHELHDSFLVNFEFLIESSMIPSSFSSWPRRFNTEFLNNGVTQTLIIGTKLCNPHMSVLNDQTCFFINLSYIQIHSKFIFNITQYLQPILTSVRKWS